MAAPIIDHESSLDVLMEHNVYTAAKVAAHPLTRYLEPEYNAFQSKWFVVDVTETKLWIDILKGSARIAVADDALDSLVDHISNALLILTNGDREAALYSVYFNGKNPSELRRPVLGNQLAFMRNWVSSLKESPHDSLKKLGDELALAVESADKAVAELAAAKMANRQFRTIGERRALVDELNAMQKRNSGKIAEIPHTEAGKGLSNTFQESFFKKSSRKPSAGDEEKGWTSVDLIAAIAESEGRTEELRARLADTLAAEKVAEARKSTQEAKKVARDEKRAALKKAQEELDAAEKALGGDQ